MAVKITIDIFSGRRNPEVELSGKEAQEVLDRLKPQTALVGDEAERAATPILGYRGLIVEQTGTPAVKELPARFRVTGGSMVGGGLAHRPRASIAERGPALLVDRRRRTGVGSAPTAN